MGEPGLRDRHREMLKQFDWGGEDPGAELVSTDTDRLVAALIEYKQAHDPNDRRLIVGAGMSPTGNVQVHIAGRAAAAEKQETVVIKDGLARLHPAHAAYVFAQTQVSVLSEQITALDEMGPFADVITKAEARYRPSGPPMSPLTTSHFTSWAFFDACVGAANETIDTCIIEVGAAFGMDHALLRLIRLMQASRMGIYVHEDCVGDLVSLREIITGAACRAIVPAGYRGQVGELWYTRVLPPPAPGIATHVAFSTPYVLLKPGLPEWQAYFRRTLPDAPQPSRLDAYEHLMKYGPTRSDRNDFVEGDSQRFRR